jgi:hypothetical protein
MPTSLEIKIDEIVNYSELLHPNDPGIMKYFDQVRVLLLEDEEETIHFLQECKNKNTMSWIAGLLDCLPGKFPSQDLINVFELLVDRYPDDPIHLLNLNLAIDELKQALSDENEIEEDW